MLSNGKECTTYPYGMANFCNQNSAWSKERYCEQSCFDAGRGYNDSACCAAASPPTPGPSGPSTEAEVIGLSSAAVVALGIGGGIAIYRRKKRKKEMNKGGDGQPTIVNVFLQQGPGSASRFSLGSLLSSVTGAVANGSPKPNGSANPKVTLLADKAEPPTMTDAKRV